MSRARVGISLRALLVGALLIQGCASGAFRAGLGPQSFTRAPYYSGRAPSTEPLAWLPIAYQRGGAQPPVFEPASGAAMQALLSEMNTYLDSLMSGPQLTVPAPLPGSPPDVSFACAMDVAGDCLEADDEAASPAEQGRSMTLSVGRGSGEFGSWLQGALRESRTTHAMVITIEITPFWPRQTGLRGDKVVDLGTGYSQELPWLTSLDDPIWVIELTGAMLDSTGHAVRIGAEGLFAKRTRFALSAIGGTESIREEDIAQLRTLRREDLPSKPLVWRAALEALVRGLRA
jgi:hypothetical protein